MLPHFGSHFILYVLIVWTFGICYGFVLLSSAAGQNGDVNIFTPGEELIYNVHSTILLNEKNGNTKDVGFFTSGQLHVQTIWGRQNQKIIKFKFDKPNLHVKSRKAPSPDGFVYHSSNLEKFLNKPFYVHWNNGKIAKILVNRKEETSLVNIKKGIASLFQFQLLEGTTEEKDASGTCLVDYSSTNNHNLIKTKKSCQSTDLPFLRHSLPTLDTHLTSTRTVEYIFGSDHRYFKTIRGEEKHVMSVAVNANFGTEVTSSQLLEYLRSTQSNYQQNGKTSKEILNNLISSEDLSEETLLIDREAPEKNEKTLNDVLGEYREHLNPKLLGTAKSAKAFVKLVTVARRADKDDVTKALNNKKNNKILPQLLDVLGFASTPSSYEAVITKIDITKPEQLDNAERYLWALSLNAHPNKQILENLLVKYQKTVNLPEKLNQTILLTLASISRKLPNDPTAKKVEQLLVNGALAITDNESTYPYLRALKNLLSPTTIPLLLGKIKSGTTKEGVLSWKALRAFGKENWDPVLLKAARKTFFQLDRKYDTSSRTIASEILLEHQPDDQLLKEILRYIASNDKIYEIKQYVLQKIRMLADNDDVLRDRITKIIKNDKKLNNYSVLNPRGFSTAIRRYFVKNTSGNGSLVSVQEISNGVVKRGVVNIVWDKESLDDELFSLGIFTSGLTGLLSSDKEESEEEGETASGGLELTILGTQLRPFVFFNGQGELMGHVWSGTASDRTTAYQSLIMLQDHIEYLRLGSGFLVEVDTKGAVSFDLSGKVVISIWGRTAESLVEESTGIYLHGKMSVDSSFVKSQVEFTSVMEPKLNLESDIDFSSNARFCLRLSQLDVQLRHNVYKIERIPGSKHKLRIAKYRKSSAPGSTFALNKKNNEMCSQIYQTH